MKNELIQIAKSYVGVTEEGGNNQGPQVEEFQKAVDGRASREAWCAAFVWYCIKKIEVKSWLYPSEHCMTIWNRSPKEARLDKPEVGCLIIWQHWRKKWFRWRPTSSGHIGIVSFIINDDYVRTIEGNTSPDEQVEREGDGVYEKIRNVKGRGSMKVKGFLKVWENENEKEDQ